MEAEMIIRALRAALLAMLLGVAAAQNLSEAAQTALATGEAAMHVALETYDRQYPDRPLWREAIRYGKEAVRLAPDSPEPLRFLAEVYSRSNWYGPAWDTWQAFLATGASLDPEAVPLFVTVGNQLGYTRYSQGQPDAALPYYQRVLEVVPYDKEALVWMGRILLETGRPADAVPYWQTVVERDSTDARAKYFLSLAQNEVAWGPAAAQAFQDGISRYEQGQYQEAVANFTEATRQNPDFTEAYVWAGRTLLDLGRPDEAIRYWQGALERNPTDARAAYFLALARDQATWGPEVANAFRAGVEAYNAQDTASAADLFRQATDLRPDYAEAWAWRGRVAFEGGDFATATQYYERAVSLQPDNAPYQYFLGESRRRSG